MLDKILNGFGSILKFFGVMIGLIVVGAIISTIWITSDSKRSSREPEVKSVSATQPQQEAPKKDTLPDRLHLKVTNIEGADYNSIAKAYSQANFTVEITNDSGKTLKGFAGDVVIKDAFGDAVKTIAYKSDEDLLPGVSVRKLTLSLNVFDQSGQRFLALNRYSTEFKADTILTE